MVLVGCSSTATFTILWLFTTSSTCTGPYTVLATLPVIVVSPAVSGPATLWNSPGIVLEDDVEEEDDVDDPPVPLVDATGTVGTCALNDRRATRPAMVPVTARITLRMSRSSPQNSNDSKWICRRGTPAPRSASTAAEIIPDGPHT